VGFEAQPAPTPTKAQSIIINGNGEFDTVDFIIVSFGRFQLGDAGLQEALGSGQKRSGKFQEIVRKSFKNMPL
jgi:hypothetical protein